MKKDRDSNLLVRRLWFKTKRALLKTAAVLMIIWSILCFIVMLTNGVDEIGLFLIMILLFGILPLGVALYILGHLKKTKYDLPEPDYDPSKDQQLEKIVLAIAVSQDGLVTPADIALGSEFSLEVAKQYLESLREQGFAHLKIAENGTYVYHLPYVLSYDQKKNAESI
ncbi:hypothetical protein [Paenibacillus sp. SAFN-117]|uniref:hypothetical protein n=1 Tax=Paenibacillus sp. SAFN-117 TaxID=3436860 RepID=UPI003F8019E7